MKKSALLLVIVLAFAVFTSAQKSKLSGSWLLTKVEVGGEVHYPFFINDFNENGKWDTGEYLKKLQPEPVELLPVTIEVRSNWDHDVSMNLEK